MITTFYATSQFISTQRGADETRMVFGMNELLPRFIPWNFKKKSLYEEFILWPDEF